MLAGEANSSKLWDRMHVAQKTNRSYLVYFSNSLDNTENTVIEMCDEVGVCMFDGALLATYISVNYKKWLWDIIRA